MRKRGHAVLVTAREKECATEILERSGIPYELISRRARGSVGQAVEFVGDISQMDLKFIAMIP